MTEIRRIVDLAVLAVAVGAIAGCAMLGVGNDRERSFEVYQDAPQRGDRDLVPSSFIPTDAENLRIRVVTDGPGAIVGYESPSAPIGDDCRPASLADDPLLTARWWPDDVPAEGLICGDWQIFEQDGTTFAFRR